MSVAEGPVAGAGALEERLRAHRATGRKLLIPYVMAGTSDDWTDVVQAVAAAGADAVEVGIPFSDPMIDGPVIQRAATVALARATTPASVLSALSKLDAGVPLIVMTYYNIIFHAGLERAAGMLADAGVAGAILPDVPLDEVGPWADAADTAGIATVLLAAPTTGDDRMRAICARARGFVYGVGLMGVTGERQDLAASAGVIARRLKAITEVPVLVGIGVSTPAQAVQVAGVADGAVVGSALVRRLLAGGGPDGAAAFVAELRGALDAPGSPAAVSGGRTGGDAAGPPRRSGGG
ncbi:MAG: tryptophan synthase subunit alpha [Actinomycetota bacterium]|nr:tryptophan synthase subunit alpha [Actinomycetota bacterium]